MTVLRDRLVCWCALLLTQVWPKQAWGGAHKMNGPKPVGSLKCNGNMRFKYDCLAFLAARLPSGSCGQLAVVIGGCTATRVLPLPNSLGKFNLFNADYGSPCFSNPNTGGITSKQPLCAGGTRVARLTAEPREEQTPCFVEGTRLGGVGGRSTVVTMFSW